METHWIEGGKGGPACTVVWGLPSAIAAVSRLMAISMAAKSTSWSVSIHGSLERAFVAKWWRQIRLP